jgi:hypothetical protein
MSSAEFASDVRVMNAAFPALTVPLDHPSPVRRSSRARSSEPDSPGSAKRQRQVSSSSLRLPRGVQRQSRNGAAYSGWVTVEGYRLLGPARPTAELASLDRERLAEAKMMGGLPEARKVIQQLHAEVASTRRIKSQYLTSMPVSPSQPQSSIQLRSSSMSHLSPLTRGLPKFVSVITPCGSKDTWFMRQDKLFASYVPRSDLSLEEGVYVLEFGTLRNTMDEARRDANPSEEPVAKEEMAELGSTRISQQQDAVWGFCGVAETVIENRTAYTGVCVFCDVVLTAGPARGSRSSAESDAFLMVSDVLASGISYAANRSLVSNQNPAEDLFLPQTDRFTESVAPSEEASLELKSIEESTLEMEDDKETIVPITPSGPVEGALMMEETEESESAAEMTAAESRSSWSQEVDQQ